MMCQAEMLRAALRSDILDQAACKNHGFEERFDHQIAAELLHDDHRRQRTAAKAAGAFLEWRRAEPELTFVLAFPIRTCLEFAPVPDCGTAGLSVSCLARHEDLSWKYGHCISLRSSSWLRDFIATRGAFSPRPTIARHWSQRAWR